ncbi:MAG: Tad domain-containing protein [Pseudomonadota bacterium]
MSRTTKNIKNFAGDKQGSMAIAGGLLAAVGMVTGGLAIEYGQAVSHKMELQKALDAAAIAVCTRGNRSAQEVIEAHLTSSLSQMNKTLKDEEGNGDITLANAEPNEIGVVSPRLTSTINSVFLDFPILGFTGINDFDIEVDTSVACGSKRLELSLMLDVTGSMCWTGPSSNGTNSCAANSTGNKLASMKDAVRDVLDIFEPNMAVGKTKIGFVPFSETVNVGDLADDVRGIIPEGTSQWPGYKHYQHPDENWNYMQTKKISNCVTGRTGTEAYTDAAPNNAPVGLNYPNENGDCNPTAEIKPLTSNRTALLQEIDTYAGAGGTAGHLGVAWAWYLLSPEWGYLWPNSGIEQPNEEELVKATIIMTDGEFNTQYCEGVKDWQNGWCNNPTKSSAQAAQLCEAMKAAGIQVYTVGFQVNVSGDPNNPTAQQKLLQDCASGADKYFFPYDGNELRAAFASIGEQLAAGQIGRAVVQQ